ncbi:hypothetical protein [Endozoicomonas sp. SCSIO W0465]|uniref:hypothetical protein n=1 Tax=Endozoicomonas sp. SCSIO W0465 TaxID=2918516 RepID=UPI0020763A7D|nr:hypothetical protein [Endozoicomonas sp. SCSIO W0465]USE39210.1 hypothetical protein MJO57_14255 [Endozoicomonas sp. SCSIO W0465]
MLNSYNRLLNRMNLSLDSENNMNVRSEKTGIEGNEVLISSNNNDVKSTESSNTEVLENSTTKNPYSGKIGTIIQVNNTDKTDKPQGYSLNPGDYVFCHVLIYQFVKYGVPTLKPERKLQFQAYGLDNHDVFDAFCLFVEAHQDALRRWYQSEASIEVPNLTADDVLFAQISGGIYESA